MNPIITLDDLVRWSEDNPHHTYRLTVGGHNHVGYLSVQQHIEGDGSKGSRYIHVRDSARGARRQYQSVFQRHLDEGTLQIKVGARFQPAAKVIASLPKPAPRDYRVSLHDEGHGYTVIVTARSEDDAIETAVRDSDCTDDYTIVDVTEVAS